MNLVHNPIARKSSTILLPPDSFLFLQDKSFYERCGKHYSEKQMQRLTRNFEQFGHGGYKQLKSGDLGGCNGVPENAWEEHRWTTWSIEDMKNILNEAGFSWKDGEEVEYISV